MQLRRHHDEYGNYKVTSLARYLVRCCNEFSPVQLHLHNVTVLAGIEVSDQVLVMQDKTDTFHSMPHKVVHRDGNSVNIQSPTGAIYAWNTTFVKRFHKVETPTVNGDMKCAQEPNCDEEQKGIAEECKMNCETIQREEQTPKTYKP